MVSQLTLEFTMPDDRQEVKALAMYLANTLEAGTRVELLYDPDFLGCYGRLRQILLNWGGALNNVEPWESVDLEHPVFNPVRGNYLLLRGTVPLDVVKDRSEADMFRRQVFRQTCVTRIYECLRAMKRDE